MNKLIIKAITEKIPLNDGIICRFRIRSVSLPIIMISIIVPIPNGSFKIISITSTTIPVTITIVPYENGETFATPKAKVSQALTPIPD